MRTHEELRRSVIQDYLTAVLRSRRAVDRIFAAIADAAEADPALAREIASRPEALKALAKCAAPADWLVRAAAAGNVVSRTARSAARGPAKSSSMKEKGKKEKRETKGTGRGGKRRQRKS
ncbi:hypothetical protein [Paenibacillus sp.]|uniref:hypothetical protein n=1 Tax=Paenibacillus sp. TaxID=58172 RepID=UPI002D512815|nr:hypothetical protein [Paenibacillus sp.]HZG87113.1 hypothetical protein [Paenibacillus sp.]